MFLAEDPSEKLASLALGNRLIKKFHILVIKGPTSNKPVSQFGSQPTVKEVLLQITVEDFSCFFAALLTPINS